MILAQGILNLPAELAVLSLIAAGAAITVVVLLRRRRALARIRRAARRLALGDLGERIEPSGPAHMRALAKSLNQMAAQLQERLATVMQQRNELGAVLSSMVEGVLAIDGEEKVLSLNRAAAQMLEVDPRDTIGRPIQEAVRNSALQQFVSEALRQSQAAQIEVSLLSRAPGERTSRQVQVQSATLRDAGGARIGVVIVLHDVTQLRRLESVRQEFVGNVSHELRTPVSTIKAAAETLMSANEDVDPARQRFLEMIERQADRMGAIVDDLLSLAHIEQESGEIRAQLEPTRVAEVIRRASEPVVERAESKSMELEIDCDAELEALANPPLLEQAVANLVENAVKYGPEGARVDVLGLADGQEVVIEVRDTGRGIEPQHLPRIFERFYRTDRARSRAVGGTGLGLSIVKHIAEAHGGRVSVDSQLGRGSAFRIHLQPA
ncbi:MAG: sensor histidine kinase [Phycisphaeraceae bacterium]